MGSQDLLRQEILKLTENQPAQYLARQLGLDSSNLSRFLNGKRPFRRRAATKYFKSVLDAETWRKIEGEFDFEETGQFQDVRLYRENENGPVLNQDEYQVHADPIFNAIMVMFFLEDFENSIDWMAARLGVNRKEMEEKIRVLVRVGLMNFDGEFLLCNRRPKLTDGVRNPAMTERKERLFDCARKAFELPNDRRDFYDWTCALDPADIPEFKKEIRRLVQQFDRKQRLSRPKEIYTFMTCLFPADYSTSSSEANHTVHQRPEPEFRENN